MKKTLIIFLLILLQGCEELLNEPNISIEMVLILAPSSDAELAAKSKINYHWQELAGASEYQLQVATPTFTNAQQIKLDTIISDRTFSIDSLQVGDYQWRVRALNNAYATTYTTSSFVIK